MFDSVDVRFYPKQSYFCIAVAAEMRKYPNPAYINYLTTFKNMGVPMPDGKWWGHRREKAPGKKYIDSRVFNMTLRTVFIVMLLKT